MCCIRLAATTATRCPSIAKPRSTRSLRSLVRCPCRVSRAPKLAFSWRQSFAPSWRKTSTHAVDRVPITTRFLSHFVRNLQPFIDRLYLNQAFPDGCPDLFNGYVARIDPDGNFERLSPQGAILEGTFDTRILAISHAGRASLRGNPGRWGRPDNVFGFDFEETFRRANAIGRAAGLREFTFGNRRFNSAATPTEVAKHGVWRWDGATVTALDVTANFATGSRTNAAAFLGWLEGQRVERVKGTTVNKGSVRFGGGRGLQVECYDKADELIAHAKGDEAKQAMRKSDLYQWLCDEGIVRLEVRLKRDHLRAAEMGYAGAISMEKVTQLFGDKTKFLTRISNDVDAFDFTNLPFRLAGIARQFMAGEDVKARMKSRATFYRNRSMLLPYGIDIAARPKVLTFAPKVREIELRQVEAPSWYWAREAA